MTFRIDVQPKKKRKPVFVCEFSAGARRLIQQNKENMSCCQIFEWTFKKHRKHFRPSWLVSTDPKTAPFEKVEAFLLFFEGAHIAAIDFAHGSSVSFGAFLPRNQESEKGDRRLGREKKWRFGWTRYELLGGMQESGFGKPFLCYVSLGIYPTVLSIGYCFGSDGSSFDPRRLIFSTNWTAANVWTRKLISITAKRRLVIADIAVD